MAKTVLVVDDSSMIRKVVGSMLTTAGFVVEESSDGGRALSRLQDGPPVDLVVCDVHMPKLNGIELLEELRELSIPLPKVIFLSTEGSPRVVRRARELGASGYLLKPVQKEVLLQAVQDVLAKVA